MKRFLLASLMPLIILGLAREASAEPPANMDAKVLVDDFFVCDTPTQLAEVVEAIKIGILQAKLDEMSTRLNESGKPICEFRIPGYVVFGESKHIGVITDEGLDIDMWISHTGNPQGDFYILWGEQLHEMPT